MFSTGEEERVTSVAHLPLEDEDIEGQEGEETEAEA